MRSDPQATLDPLDSVSSSGHTDLKLRTRPTTFCVPHPPEPLTLPGHLTLSPALSRNGGRLSQALRVPPSALATAGIKDKKAVTHQFLTVQGVTATRLRDAGNTIPGERL